MHLLLGLSLFFSGPVHAETTATEFLQQYKMASDDGKRWLVGYITGIVTGYGWANTTLKVKEQAQLYCMSDEEALGDEEILGLVAREARKDKKVGYAPFGMAVLTALSRRFPCGKKNAESGPKMAP